MANPTLMSMPICRDAEKNTIPATDNGTTGKFSEQYGWQSINSLPLSAGGKAVERLDFNGVLGLLGGIDYMTQRGYTFEYDNTLPYVTGCIVIDTLDGKIYRCVNDVPAGGSAPSLDTTNWIPYDISDYVGGALRLTNYSVGDTSNLAGIPAGYFLECTTGGTTGATAPVVTSPVSAGDTIADGTVVWIVRKSASTQDLTGYLTINGGVSTDNFSLRVDSDTKRIRLVGGTQYLNGASLDLYGGQANEGGVFILATADGNNIAYFQGYPNGDLAWKVNNTAYSLAETAVVSSSLGQNGYVKYKSGLIKQWGFHEVGTNSITLPVAFADNKYSFVITPYSNATSTPAVIVTAKGPNWVNIYFETAPIGGAYWMAMGY